MRPSWRVRDRHAGAWRFTVLKVVVGLGNPGKQYEQTRHNVGWMVLDRLADRAGWGGTVKARDAAAVARGRYRGLDLVLVKPTTFMNESGVAVRKALARERAPLEDLLVVVDDFALPFGKLRMRERGSAGSHNGLRSIIGELENDDFARLRIGIGEPSRDAVRHVLTRFSEDERAQLDRVLDAAADAVEDWAREGPSKASNRWNTWQLPEDAATSASSAAQAGKSDPPTEGGIRRTRTGWRRLLPG
jgi:PTH1 family peptidyl-tRNA hydrolase